MLASSETLPSGLLPYDAQFTPRMVYVRADPNTSPPFGDLLRHYRHAANLTQEQLAELAKVSARAVSDLERGFRQYPRRDTLQLLVDALGLVGADQVTFLAAARRPPSPHQVTQRDRRAARTTLPTPPSPLIGREPECAQVVALLQRGDVRLLSLTGRGGVGKTRLALRVASDMVDEFSDGVHFIDLTPLSDHRLVLPTIARTLGVQEEAGQTLWERLVAHLADKQLLLLLDTFERVVDGGRDLADLLAASAGLTLLVTSREPLRIRAERRFRVDPLPVPEHEYLPLLETLSMVPSVALFVDRAQAVHHDFALTAENAVSVATICRRLEGLPLAIELAAAHSDEIPIAELPDQLARSITFLSEDLRDLPPRQQNLWATLAWSYELLSPAEQHVLRHLAPFAGGCTIDAMAVVAGEALSESALHRLLASLATRHLMRIETTPDETKRYALPDMVREFVSDLADADEQGSACRAHASYFRDLAESSEIALEGPDQRRMLDRLEHDLANLRAALTWSLEENEAETALRLASALWTFWEMRGYVREGREWLERALALEADTPAALRAKAITAAAGLAEVQGDYRSAVARYEDAIPLWQAAGMRSGLARALNNLGIVFDNQGEYDRAAMLYEAALAIFREVGDAARIAIALNNLGTLAYGRGEFAHAQALHEEALTLRRTTEDEQGVTASLTNLAVAISALDDDAGATNLLTEALARYRALGDLAGIAGVLLNLGMIASRRGDLEMARRYDEEALVIQRRLNDDYMTAMLLNNLAEVFRRQGDSGKAFAVIRESLELRQTLSDQIGIGLSLMAMANIAGMSGLAERAARWLGTAEAIFDAVGYVMHPAERAQVDDASQELRARLGEEGFISAREGGRATTIESAIAEAFALERDLGHADLMRG